MAAFDGLQRASFAGFEFPVSEITITGGARDHVHEYPHSPGGAPEKLGRKLYEFRMVGLFQQGFKSYRLLYPETLFSLRIVWEGQRTFDLVVPTLGTIQAYPISWVERAEPKRMRNGVTVEMVYREDASDLFLVKELIKTGTSGLGTDLDTFETVIVIEGLGLIELFIAIIAMANEILAIKDQGDLLASVVIAKTEALTRLCAEADTTLDVLDDPVHFRVLDALHALWASSIRLNRDALRRAQPLDAYIVPPGVIMSVLDVSRAVYGDSSRAVEIMRNNALDDPFAIRGPFPIRVYQNAA